MQKKNFNNLIIAFFLIIGIFFPIFYQINITNYQEIPQYFHKNDEEYLRTSNQKEILRVAMVGDISTLDPVDSWDPISNYVIDQITEPLFWVDISSQSSPDDPLEIVPFLAKNYSYNIDNTILTIGLRKGIRFHDGEVFNADAAIYSLERLMYFTNSSGDLNSGTPLAKPWSLYYFSESGTPIIKDVQKTGDYQINITLNAPYGPFIQLLSYTASNIVSPNTPKYTYLDYSNDILVGTGPFTLEYYNPTVECSFEKNENWWGGIKEDGTSIGSVSWDEIIYEIYPDGTTASDALLNDHVAYGDLVQSYYPQARDDPSINLTDWGTGRTFFYWGLNCKKFSQKLRVAMAYSLNYSYITEIIRNELSVKANTCISSAFPEHNASIKPPDYNLTRARQLMQDLYPEAPTDIYDDQAWLDKAEIDPLEHVKLFRHMGSHFNELLNIMVEDNFANIGIDTSEDINDWTTFQNWVSSGRDNLEMWYIGWQPFYFNALTLLEPLYYPNSHNAAHQAWVPESDISTEYQNTIEVWLNAMKVETDPIVRNDYAKKIQYKLFHGEDAFLPHIPMFYNKLTYTHDSSLEGVNYNGFDKWYWADTSGNISYNLIDLRIINPTQGKIFGKEAPEYTLELKTGTVDQIWYTLDNGETNFTGSLSGKIDNETWNGINDGDIEIRFWANNSDGYKTSKKVSVIKDTTNPIITIISPQYNNTYGENPPSFEVEIEDANLNKTWYLISNHTEKHLFTTNGTIDEQAWDSLNDGEIVIEFCANDSVGLESIEKVKVFKNSSLIDDGDNGDDLTENLEIPGYNLKIFFPITLLALILVLQKIVVKSSKE